MIVDPESQEDNLYFLKSFVVVVCSGETGTVSFWFCCGEGIVQTCVCFVSATGSVFYGL